MKITLIDGRDGAVTVTDVVGVRGSVEAMERLLDALHAALDMHETGLRVELVEDGLTGEALNPNAAPLVRAAAAVGNAVVGKPWMSTEPPPVALDMEEFEFLDRLAKGTIRIGHLNYDMEQFAQSHSVGEHKLVSIDNGEVVIEPAGVWALQQWKETMAGLGAEGAG